MPTTGDTNRLAHLLLYSRYFYDIMLDVTEDSALSHSSKGLCFYWRHKEIHRQMRFSNSLYAECFCNRNAFMVVIE